MDSVRWCLVVLLSTLCSHPACWSDEPITERQSRSFELDVHAGKSSSATFDLGTVEREKPLDIVVRLTNVGDEPMSFNDVIISCSCTKADVPKSTFRNGQILPARLELKAPQITYTDRIQYAVTLTNPKQDTSIELSFLGRLKDFISFTEADYGVEMTDFAETIAVPLKLRMSRDYPWRSKKLELTNVEGLTVTEMEPTSEDGVLAIACELDASVIPPDRSQQQVFLQADGKVVSTAMLHFAKHEPVRVLPPLAVASHVADGGWKANTLLRYELENHDAVDFDTVKIELVTNEASAPDFAGLKVVANPLSGNTVRLTISGSSRQPPGSSQKFKVSINHNNRTITTQLLIRF